MEVLAGFKEKFDKNGNCKIWSWSSPNGVIFWKRKYFDYDDRGRPRREKHYERFSKNEKLKLIYEKEYIYE